MGDDRMALFLNQDAAMLLRQIGKRRAPLHRNSDLGLFDASIRKPQDCAVLGGHGGPQRGEELVDLVEGATADDGERFVQVLAQSRQRGDETLGDAHRVRRRRDVQ
ncbi:MAG: hypothetical protein R3D52_05425 [Xanthobacteraceae bacterium]